MSLFHCELPLPITAPADTRAANQSQFSVVHLHPSFAAHGNVRYIRRSSDCYALTGKCSDVCAALDRLVQQEAAQRLASC